MDSINNTVVELRAEADGLKPCPFCGSKKVAVTLERFPGWKANFISCTDCNAQGGWFDATDGRPRQQAIVAWNNRVVEKING